MIAALAVAFLLQAPPRFTAASVRPDRTGTPAHSDWTQPGRLTIVGANFRQLLTRALGLASLSDAANLVFGWPAWTDSLHFDVEATAAGQPDAALKRAMLLTLLHDRFALVVHRETRTRPVYLLQVDRPGRLGPDLHPRAAGAPCPVDPNAADPMLHFPCGEFHGGLVNADATSIWAGARSESMDALAGDMGDTEAFDRPVIDRTGLAGLYDFKLEWRHLADRATPDAPRAAVIAALREQLGLKLAAANAPLVVWVIDHAAPPAGD